MHEFDSPGRGMAHRVVPAEMLPCGDEVWEMPRVRSNFRRNNAARPLTDAGTAQ